MNLVSLIAFIFFVTFIWSCKNLFFFYDIEFGFVFET